MVGFCCSEVAVVELSEELVVWTLLELEAMWEVVGCSLLEVALDEEALLELKLDEGLELEASLLEAETALLLVLGAPEEIDSSSSSTLATRAAGVASLELVVLSTEEEEALQEVD